jgi:hypothetical protein
MYEEFRPRTIWSLSNAFTSAFKDLEPIPQFKAIAKLGEFWRPSSSSCSSTAAVPAGPPLLFVNSQCCAESRTLSHRFLEPRLNEAALRRTLSRARSKRHRRFETRSLAELSVSGYDGATMSLGLMVRFDELLFEGRPASIFRFKNFHTEID